LRQAECRQQYPTNHDDRPIEDWLLLTGDVRDGRWGAIATQILLRDQRAFALEGIIVIAGESIDVQWPAVIKPMDELVTVVPSVGELPAAVMKPACDAGPARGDPKPMDELLRIAQVKGLDPKHTHSGVLHNMEYLRNQFRVQLTGQVATVTVFGTMYRGPTPDGGWSINALALACHGGKKKANGSNAKRTKDALIGLEQVQLVERVGDVYQLGSGAFVQRTM